MGICIVINIKICNKMINNGEREKITIFNDSQHWHVTSEYFGLD